VLNRVGQRREQGLAVRGRRELTVDTHPLQADHGVGIPCRAIEPFALEGRIPHVRQRRDDQAPHLGVRIAGRPLDGLPVGASRCIQGEPRRPAHLDVGP
jgi:hypothetical protein